MNSARATSSLDVQSFYESGTGSWSYLLADRSGKRAAVVDPVWLYDPVSGLTDSTFLQGILARANQHGYRIDWVLETHAHADHLTGAAWFRSTCGAKVAIGRGIRAVQETFKRVYHVADYPADSSAFDRVLSQGDCIPVGELEVRVMETPGHTSDSITYCVENAAFVGDTLFEPCYGTARCDFPGGSSGALFDSVQKIYALPDQTRLFLCHDYPHDGVEPICEVSVSESRQTNVHINAKTYREDFVRLRADRDATLGLPRLILPALQINIRAGEPPPAEANGVSYLKIPFDAPLQGLVAGMAKRPV